MRFISFNYDISSLCPFFSVWMQRCYHERKSCTQRRIRSNEHVVVILVCVYLDAAGLLLFSILFSARGNILHTCIPSINIFGGGGYIAVVKYIHVHVQVMNNIFLSSVCELVNTWTLFSVEFNLVSTQYLYNSSWGWKLLDNVENFKIIIILYTCISVNIHNSTIDNSSYQATCGG